MTNNLFKFIVFLKLSESIMLTKKTLSMELDAPLLLKQNNKSYSKKDLCKEFKILDFVLKYSCCWIKRDNNCINFIVYLFALFAIPFAIYDMSIFNWQFARVIYDIVIQCWIFSRLTLFYFCYDQSQIYFYFASTQMKNTKLYFQLRLIMVSFFILMIPATICYFIDYLYYQKILNGKLINVIELFFGYFYAFWLWYIPCVCASFLIAIYCWKCIHLMNNFKVMTMNDNDDVNLSYEYLKIHDEIVGLINNYLVQTYFACTILTIVILIWWFLTWQLLKVFNNPFDLSFNLIGFSFVLLSNYPMIYYVILMNNTAKQLTNYIIQEMVDSNKNEDILNNDELNSDKRKQRLSQILVVMYHKQIAFNCFGFMIDAKKLISPIIVYVGAKLVSFLYDWVIDKGAKGK